MADKNISPLGESYPASHRQVMLPNPLYASFDANDTDNHDFKFKGMGKGRMTIGINNASDKTVTWALYGSFDEDGDVGDIGVFPIQTGIEVSAASKDYEVCNDPFPFYLVRATVATGANGQTVTVFINVSAY